ncbi:universal stress protein [Marivirga sp. S37H4]|uniref:Universal stress protein n=1 Tax=Marivirga aurantiaca TaxID=2802615 RepID=A0A934WZ98_9BACT|nr:universal stress protein [Marivirga aurantiaca]MBK6265958.1 universal stress protein [Marivirga aurantiaca]
MYKIERILVALDLTEMDEVLIRYTSQLAKHFQTEKIYFFHVANTFELPEEVRKNYPDLLAPTDESLKRTMEAEIKEHWTSDHPCEKVVEITEGNATDQLLKWIDIKIVDLIVMGRKRSLEGSGVLPQKITKVAHSSVLLVPETVNEGFNKIVVPIDFSKHSKLALEEAVDLSTKTGAKLQLLNTYKVPSGYHRTGKSREEFAAIMKKHAETDFKKFLKRNNFKEDLNCEYILDNNSPADTIFEFAKREKADLIVMGSKGRTEMASMLLGSVTEKVINYDTDIPLLVVKEKDENMGFFKALMKV